MNRFTLRCGTTAHIEMYVQRLSITAVRQVRLSEARQQTVPDSRSSCIESSVAQVDLRPTDEKRTSVSRVQSPGTRIGNEAAVIRQVALGACPRQRPMDQGGDIELFDATGKARVY